MSETSASSATPAAPVKIERKSREPAAECETIFVRLPRYLGESQVRDLFSDCAPIKTMRYIFTRGVAFLTFATIDDAKDALSKHDGKVWKVVPSHSSVTTELEWPVKVDFARPRSDAAPKPMRNPRRRYPGAPPRGPARSLGRRRPSGPGPMDGDNSIYVRIPRFTTYQQAKESLLKDCPPCRIFLRARALGRPAFLVAIFNSAGDAAAALKILQTKVWTVAPGASGRSREINWRVSAWSLVPSRSFRGRRWMRPNARPPLSFSETEVAVTNLPDVVDEDGISEIFNDFKVVKAIVRDSARKRDTKVAIVTFPSHEEQLRAIADINQIIVNEHTISVKPARAFPPRNPPRVAAADAAAVEIKRGPKKNAEDAEKTTSK